jgi:hypothetical protein
MILTVVCTEREKAAHAGGTDLFHLDGWFG